jgi:Domain of Unknown Function (DUF1080)
MKKTFLSLIIISTITLMTSSCNNAAKTEETTTDSTSTDSTTITNNSNGEDTTGWISLFDGNSFAGWRGYNKDSMPGAWSVDAGVLKIGGSGEGEAGANNGGDIIYDRKFKDFELTFEWKVSPGGNSGVFYLAQEVKADPIYKSSPEYQVLDNERHPDAKLGKNGNRKSASLYDLIPAKPQNAKPAGEWNTGGIMVYKGTVVHKLNGENVVEYHLWTDDWKKMVEGSKFKGWNNFLNAGGTNREGFIGLQDHGDDVWYRNIKLKVLD